MIHELKGQIVDACRILAGTASVHEMVCAVSVRLPGTNEMLVRCRRSDDPGIAFTTIDDVKRVDFDGNGAELTGGYHLPEEFWIHGELYRQRPDAGAIVHDHPRASVLCGILGLPFRPVVGAYDTWALEVTLAPIPVFPRAIPIDSPELGREVAATMGDANVCLLQGHGIVAVGGDVPVATVRAIKLESMAELIVEAYSTGREPKVLSDEDIAEKMDAWRPRSATYARWIWDFYVRKLGPASTR